MARVTAADRVRPGWDSRTDGQPYKGLSCPVRSYPQPLGQNGTDRDSPGLSVPVRLSLSDQLRTLAHRVERLAVSGRTDPEEVVSEKQLIGRALRRLAKEAAA